MSFCLDDGSELLYGPADEQKTAILPTDVASEAATRAQVHMTEAEPPTRLGSLTEKRSFSPNRTAKPLMMFTFLLVILIAGFFAYRYVGSGSKQIESIAVMPFVNESGNQDVEYLSDGMTETLISRLTEIPKLSVKARSTVFYYKGKEKTVREIGEELKVEAVLLGRIAQRGESLTLNLELVDPKTLDAIWSETYERKMSDIVSLQSEIARNVSDKLRLKLTTSEQRQVAKTYTTNPEAQQLYLEGRFYWNKRNTEGFLKAKDYFQQAVALDPNYALAYAGLSDTYALIPNYGPFRPLEYVPMAKQAAQRALELDPDLAEGHASLGQTLSLEYDWVGAERELRKAIDLNPKYPSSHQWLAEVLDTKQKHDEAILQIDKALELDSLSMVINRVKGNILVNAGKVDEAIVQLKKTVELFPDVSIVRGDLGYAYEVKGMYDEAVDQYLTLAKMDGRPIENIKRAGAIYEKEGWRGFWTQVLEFSLENRRQILEKDKNAVVNNYAIALFYARLQDKDKTLDFLSMAYQARNPGLINIKTVPLFDFLRDDPRFTDLLKRMNLSE